MSAASDWHVRDGEDHYEPEPPDVCAHCGGTGIVGAPDHLSGLCDPCDECEATGLADYELSRERAALSEASTRPGQSSPLPLAGTEAVGVSLNAGERP